MTALGQKKSQVCQTVDVSLWNYENDVIRAHLRAVN
jgi:hypothetical protein